MLKWYTRALSAILRKPKTQRKPSHLFNSGRPENHVRVSTRGGCYLIIFVLVFAFAAQMVLTHTRNENQPKKVEFEGRRPPVHGV